MTSARQKFQWQAFGHNKQKGYLETAVIGNRLAQSYLFLGPDRIGKTALALDFARILMCMSKDNRPCGHCYNCKLGLDNSTDFAIIDQEDEIKISQIRELQHKFLLHSFAKSYRVVVIGNAYLLNAEAVNSLLKALEETKSQQIFILTTTSVQTLHPTIVSRSQRIYFTLPTNEEFLDFLMTQRLTQEKSAILESVAATRYGIAKKLISDEQLLDEYKGKIFELEALISENRLERLLRTSSLASLEALELNQLLNYWLMVLDSTITREKKDIKSKIKLIDAIVNALQNIKLNVNRKLTLDTLAVSV